MYLGRFIFLLINVLLISNTLLAQDITCKTIALNVKQVMDTLTIIPQSITLKDLEDSLFHINYNPDSGEIQINTYFANLTEAEVCYRTLPYALNATVGQKPDTLKDTVITRNSNLGYIEKKEELFSTGTVNSAGSITRGFSFGSNHDLNTNSTLNLNLNGKINDDLNIRASITDQRVPYQPEGNTLRINDLNKVFLELYNDKFSIIGGDIVFESRNSRFLKYKKNVKGGKLNINHGENGTTTTGFSIGKGRFAAVTIEPEEGVSGPYKIPSPKEMEFVILLANSEKVYLDGKLLTRGFNNDYVIDYNQAEITFTTNVLISKFSRIKIEYEYNSFSYQRSVAFAGHHQTIGRSSFYINAYNENDNKNSSSFLSLNDSDRSLLSNIGDSIHLAQKVSADSIGFQKGMLLYKKMDTVDIDGMVHQIFKYSQDSNGVYQVRFREVGKGKGNYIRSGSTINGRIYTWIAPLGGTPQGDYAPVMSLPAPGKKQMVTVGSSIKLSDYSELYTEFATSNLDKNLYSEHHDSDNTGFAVNSGFRLNGKPVGGGYKLSTLMDIEYTDQNFMYVERFRSVDYDRNWSFNPANEINSNSDLIMNLKSEIEKNTENRFSYEIKKRRRGTYINGIQQTAEIHKSLGLFQLHSNGFLMKNDRIATSSHWMRGNLDFFYRIGKIIPGYQFNLDKNRITSQKDSVISSAMHYSEHKFYFKNDTSWKPKLEASYAIRKDDSPHYGEMKTTDRSHTANIVFGTDIGKEDHIDFRFVYRKLSADPTTDNDEYITGRLDWSGALLERTIKMDLNYTISGGRELKREFIYVQVPLGEGTHTWRDENSDGIMDLNEFYEAINYDERNFIKMFVPTNEYISASSNLLNFRMNIKFPMDWKDAGGVRQFLYKISNLTSWNARNKVTGKSLNSRFNILSAEANPDNVLGQNSVIRSTFFYNRSSSRFGINAGYLLSSRKSLLTGGFEFRESEDYDMTIRFFPDQFYGFKLKLNSGNKHSSSDFLTNRNYIINYHLIKPTITWQPNLKVRLSTSYIYQNRQSGFNAEQPGRASVNEILTELRYAKTGNTSLNTFFSVKNIDYEGPVNNALGYELLHALQPGINLDWSVSYMQKLTNGMQISLNYYGRKSGGSRIIHTGRMAVSALF